MQGVSGAFAAVRAPIEAESFQFNRKRRQVALVIMVVGH